jgi:hypothetical protein
VKGEYSRLLGAKDIANLSGSPQIERAFGLSGAAVCDKALGVRG